MLRAALWIVNWHPGMLLFDHTPQGIRQHEVAGKREYVGARHHHLADGDVIQFQGLVDHLLLKRRDLSELPACGHNELELVGRVYRTLSNAPRTEYTQDPAGGPAHHEKQGTSQGEEHVHRPGHGEGYLFGTLQGQGFRDEF